MGEEEANKTKDEISSLKELAAKRVQSGKFTPMDMIAFRMLETLEDKKEFSVDDTVKVFMLERALRGKEDSGQKGDPNQFMRDFLMFKMLDTGKRDPEIEYLMRRLELQETFNPILTELRELRNDLKSTRRPEQEDIARRLKSLEDRISDLKKSSLDDKVIDLLSKERERADRALEKAEKDRISLLQDRVKLEIDGVKKAIESLPGKGEAGERRREIREKKAFEALDKVIDVVDKHIAERGEGEKKVPTESENIEREIKLATDEIKKLKEEMTQAEAETGAEEESEPEPKERRRIRSYA